MEPFPESATLGLIIGLGVGAALVAAPCSASSRTTGLGRGDSRQEVLALVSVTLYEAGRSRNRATLSLRHGLESFDLLLKPRYCLIDR